MGTTHGLAILNGLHRFPTSCKFTCSPHRHGASVVDYVLAQPSFIPLIKHLSIGPRPVGVAVDHALLTFTISFQFNAMQMMQMSGHTRYTFLSGSDPVYKDGLFRRLVDKNPECPLKELIEILTKAVHEAALEAYPHSQPHYKCRFGSMLQNSWYDEECREMRITLQKEVLLGIRTQKQSRMFFRRLVRRKKRNYLAQLEREIYHLFLSQDSAEAWKLFREQAPPLAITSTEIWGKYATSLYSVPGQPPLPHPMEPCPKTCTFFTNKMVKKAIDKMKTRRSYDHEGLVAEHLIHAKDIVARQSHE